MTFDAAPALVVVALALAGPALEPEVGPVGPCEMSDGPQFACWLDSQPASSTAHARHAEPWPKSPEAMWANS